MATITTISAGDLNRVQAAIGVAVENNILNVPDAVKETIAKQASKRVLATLGIKVVDQSILEIDQSIFPE